MSLPRPDTGLHCRDCGSPRIVAGADTVRLLVDATEDADDDVVTATVAGLLVRLILGELAETSAGEPVN